MSKTNDQLVEDISQGLLDKFNAAVESGNFGYAGLYSQALKNVSEYYDADVQSSNAALRKSERTLLEAFSAAVEDKSSPAGMPPTLRDIVDFSLTLKNIAAYKLNLEG